MPKLTLPKDGIAIRMYRQGHGDCFLLALPRNGGGDPIYVLIDCGYKPGSPSFVHNKSIGDIVDHIGESTGNQLDLVIITHEHQDHVNGIWKQAQPYFDRFTIKKAWFAWTEDPTDDVANELRKRHKDTLLSLVNARDKLVALGIGEDDRSIRRVDNLLSMEFGGEDDTFSIETMRAAAKDPTKSINKQALKLIKDKAAAKDGVSYLSPGGKPLPVPESPVRVFVLGPPRDMDLLSDEDPRGSEAFPDDNPHGFTFAAAATPASEMANRRLSPFSRQYEIQERDAFSDAFKQSEPFFIDQYGNADASGSDTDRDEVSPAGKWRRINTEWLHSMETLALKLNAGINNTSLVLAFELPTSKKVLLFAGDAQRGNWISWKDVTWKDGETTITPRDLLGRAVLYKVGHHGSHNATLAGTASDDSPNLAWMATGASAGEFTAMITAVNDWALKNSPPWVHPLPSIKRELTRKAQGRVFQTDIDQLEKPTGVSDAAWEAFQDRAIFEELYFDYTVLDTV